MRITLLIHCAGFDRNGDGVVDDEEFKAYEKAEQRMVRARKEYSTSPTSARARDLPPHTRQCPSLLVHTGTQHHALPQYSVLDTLTSAKST